MRTNGAKGDHETLDVSRGKNFKLTRYRKSGNAGGPVWRVLSAIATSKPLSEKTVCRQHPTHEGFARRDMSFGKCRRTATIALASAFSPRLCSKAFLVANRARLYLAARRST
jgi:hypothetical protein